MKKIALLLMAMGSTLFTSAQSTRDIFTNNEVQISWLGIDYAHVKLIGKFDQFGDWGEQSLSELKNDYFPAWNEVVVNEREKYNIAKMLDREEVYYDIEMMMKHNKDAKLDKLEAYNEPNYTAEDIQKFAKEYKLKDKEGIGVLFIAEAYNKASEVAIHHFVALNMKSGEVLLQERIKSKPGGFGLRNYWAGSIHEAIEKIEKDLYTDWKGKNGAE